jgi:hypothetical protein
LATLRPQFQQRITRATGGKDHREAQPMPTPRCHKTGKGGKRTPACHKLPRRMDFSHNPLVARILRIYPGSSCQTVRHARQSRLRPLFHNSFTRWGGDIAAGPGGGPAWAPAAPRATLPGLGDDVPLRLRPQ